MADRFSNMTTLVINMLEGGYFHPDMFKDSRMDKKWESVYAKSGETMFGIDRKNYGTSDKYFKEFWQLIDAAGAKYSWKYNFRGGTAENVLKKYVVEMMRNRSEKYAKLYLSEQAQKVVNADDRLTFHMVYAVWNGAGVFQKFSNKLNEAVKNTTNADKLWNIALQMRYDYGDKNGLFRQGADKMKAHFGGGSDDSTPNDNTPKTAGGGWLIGIFALLGIGGGFLTAKKMSK